jgi:[ribosomal protein S18]-alanine N-acetyltransferase
MSTTRGLDIQPLALDDVSAIEEIEQRSMPAPWSRMMFVSEIVKPTSVCLGAFVESRLVAYVIVSRYVDAWHVMNLVVAPEHRRQGIATRLLGSLFELTSDDDRRGFTLEVRVSNDAAIELYESLGFRGQGIRRGYYTDNREDALIMWRDSAGAES